MDFRNIVRRFHDFASVWHWNRASIVQGQVCQVLAYNVDIKSMANVNDDFHNPTYMTSNLSPGNPCQHGSFIYVIPTCIRRLSAHCHFIYKPMLSPFFIRFALQKHLNYFFYDRGLVWKRPLANVGPASCCKCVETLRWRHNGHNGVSNHQPHHCLLNRLFACRSKKTSKPRVTGLCAGNSPGAGEFPAQMASNAENASIWWRHHDMTIRNMG